MVKSMIRAQKLRATRAFTGSWVRMPTESVTAWICRASSGSTETSMNRVVSAPAQVLRKRKANRSARDDSW